tara:strand:- start:1294 stop:1806 length:513 start_codon:yes stop_codon:yes gene_type:complete
MACGDLPPIPEIKIPDEPKLGLPSGSIPSISPFVSFPTIPMYPGFHLNAFDITVLLWMLFRGGGNLDNYNSKTEAQKATMIAEITSATSAALDFDDPKYPDVPEIPQIIIKAPAAWVKANATQDILLDMVKRRYDGCSVPLLELTFGYCDDELLKDCKNYKPTRRKLRRI